MNLFTSATAVDVSSRENQIIGVIMSINVRHDEEFTSMNLFSNPSVTFK